MAQSYLKIFFIFAIILHSLTSFSKDSGIHIMTVKGKAYVLVDGEKSEIKMGNTLQHGQTVFTDKKSYLRLSLYQSVVTLSPGTYFRLPETSEKDSKNTNIGKLLYGHLKALFKENNNLPQRTILTPKASVAVRGTEILLHVVKSQIEYKERLWLGKIVSMSHDEVLEFEKKDFFFTQVCCLKGEISLSGEGEIQETLTVGQVFRFSSYKNLQDKSEYTQEQVYGTSRAFGLEF